MDALGGFAAFCERRLMSGNSRICGTLSVGCDREIFASDAIALLHEVAGSSLREIDRLATDSLREAARRKKKLVERDAVERVAGNIPSNGS